MMTWKVVLAVVLILVVGLVAIVNLIRKRSLELKYALTWLFLGVALLLIVLVPGLIDTMAAVLGIYSPVNMVFFLGFVFSLVVIFSLTMSMSHSSNEVRKLAQKIALNEYRSTKNK